MAKLVFKRDFQSLAALFKKLPAGLNKGSWSDTAVPHAQKEYSLADPAGGFLFKATWYNKGTFLWGGKRGAELQKAFAAISGPGASAAAAGAGSRAVQSVVASEVKSKPKAASKAESTAAAAFKPNGHSHAENAQQLVETFAPDTIVCFTDGGCDVNPGPCGSGVVVCVPDSHTPCAKAVRDEKRWEQRWRAYGEGTNNIGELSAVGVALEVVNELERAGKLGKHPIQILTDSQYARGMLDLGWKAKENKELVAGLRGLLAKRRETHSVGLHWVKAHSGIPGNERADQLATMGKQASMQGHGKEHNKQDLKTLTQPAPADADTASTAVSDGTTSHKRKLADTETTAAAADGGGEGSAKKKRKTEAKEKDEKESKESKAKPQTTTASAALVSALFAGSVFGVAVSGSGSASEPIHIDFDLDTENGDCE